MRFNFYGITAYINLKCKCGKFYGITAYKNLKCKCGKRVKRQKRFEQSINPWNIKTPTQIYEEEAKNAEQWKTEFELCRQCQEGLK